MIHQRTKCALLALAFACAGANAFAQSAIQTRNPQTIFSLQQTATASAAPLPFQSMFNGVVCTALSSNTGKIYIGPSGVTSATGYPLAAGQSISYAVSNLSAVYILDAVTTDVIACTGN